MIDEAAVSSLATLVTVAFFLTPLPSVLQINHTKQVGQVPFFPFLSMVVNCILWLKYGLLVPDMAISIVNGTGMILSLIYTTIYFRNHPNNNSLEMPLVVGGLIVFPALIYSQLVSLETATHHIGNFAALCSIIMFGSPLASLRHVIRVKSASSMSLLSVGMSFLTASLWTWYGLMRNDYNVILPNAMGAVLACVNLFVIAYYGRVDVNYRRVH